MHVTPIMQNLYKQRERESGEGEGRRREEMIRKKRGEAGERKAMMEKNDEGKKGALETKTLYKQREHKPGMKGERR